jgi:hypothetical protein
VVVLILVEELPILRRKNNFRGVENIVDNDSSLKNWLPKGRWQS